MLAVIPLLLSLPFTSGHMSMQFPYPRDNGGAYAMWQANEPMVTVHPSICHGLGEDTTVRTGNAFSAGDTIQIDMYGSASHNGGHCAFWYSTDDVTFTKIIDVKDCTLSAPQITLPVTMPTECETKCTFAFTWVPRSSGACEIYMNCADISVAGAQGGNSNPIEINFQTEFIDKAASGYGCIRVDDTTHWTTIFGDLKTDYDSTDTDPVDPDTDTDTDTNTDTDPSPVVTADADEEADSTGCYENPDLAINLANDISNLGSCGADADSNRCDDGMCCSSSGYCGPDYDGTGYLNYGSEDQYYASSDAAFEAYCANAQGDWRIVDCDDNGDDDSDDNNPGEGGSGAASHAPLLVSVVLGLAAFV